jgi:hypothetical protein
MLLGSPQASEPTRDQVAGRDVDEGADRLEGRLPVAGQTAEPPGPGEAVFHPPLTVPLSRFG